MKLITLGMAVALAAGSIGIACANPVDLIQNGDFSQTSPTVTTPTQFGNGSKNGYTATQFITGWTGNDGYEIWYPDVTAAVNDNAHSEWGIGSSSNTGKEMLYGPIPAAPHGTVTFVGLDADQTAGVQSSIGQQLTALIPGTTYTVSFDWGAAQLQSRTGATTSSLVVSFGGLTPQSTVALGNPSESFTGWESVSFNFVADSTSAFLNFLAVGTPTGLPPVALLSNVSVTHNVPEPPVLATFGGGLLGLGLLTLYARRRSMRGDSKLGGNHLS